MMDEIKWPQNMMMANRSAYGFVSVPSDRSEHVEPKYVRNDHLQFLIVGSHQVADDEVNGSDEIMTVCNKTKCTSF